MESWVELIEQFMIARGDTPPRRPVLELPENIKMLRVRLCVEELSELVIALQESNGIETLDAICDSLYVVIGTAIAHGFGPILDKAFREVHRSNMTKDFPSFISVAQKGGLKGMGYQPPDLNTILENELNKKN